MEEKFQPHLFVKSLYTSHRYTTPNNARGNNKIPERDRNTHGNKIFSKLETIWGSYEKENLYRAKENLPTSGGEYFTFKSAPNNDLKIESLDSSGARLVNVKFDSETKEESATVFIPLEKKEELIKKVKKYSDIKVQSRFNEPLVAKIESVEKTDLINLWNGPIHKLPRQQKQWIELWVDISDDEFEEIYFRLLEVCNQLKIKIADKYLPFNERVIFIINTNQKDLIELLKSFGNIAELRKLEELNSFWISSNMTTVEREDWISNALKLMTYNPLNNYVSILDTGVNNGHLLIEPFLEDNNRLTANSAWGINDTGGHGTGMAGIVIYGNLNDFLESMTGKIINHQLESVKIFPPNGQNDEDSLPIITLDAVSVGIINNPNFKRTYCFANTSRDSFDFGKPSTWSATIDNLTYGYPDGKKKLFIISAGNVRVISDFLNYPESNYNSQIESPAQSWNAISVGAYTEKTSSQFETVAKKYELSPFSRTSAAWENNWPIKPDVVFEGGNLIKRDSSTTDFHDDLQCLTTSNIVQTNKFTTINGTSAATAFASNFIAELRNYYPNAWDETLRGLMIHSANWTDAMKKQTDYDGTQSSIMIMLRTFGYGLPNLEKAVNSKSNYLTFVAEEEIQPYILDTDGKIRTNDMHFFSLPWPKETLLSMGEMDVTVRVTLSYFIEPNPREKGYSTKYSYQSCSLRFALLPPNDTPENFLLRINKKKQEELKLSLGLEKDDKIPEGYIEKIDNVNWELGAENVFKGSIHSNYWNTSAAEASECSYIAIFPQATSWWKNSKKGLKYNSKIRYSLILSIETGESSEDIYTIVKNKIAIKNLVEIK